MKVIPLKDEAATLALGASLACALRPGDVVRLDGELGAGKTTLARGLIRARHGDVEVPSPTYTLVQTYEWGEAELWHCDLYRLESPEDAWELGLIDHMEEGVSLIEWADRLGDFLPARAMTVRLDFDGKARIATLIGWDDRDV